MPTSGRCGGGRLPATCSSNWLHFSSAKVDTLLTQGVKASSLSVEDQDFNAADEVLWNDMATLPLYQRPEYFTWSDSVSGVVPNTSYNGITWNDEDWTTA